MTFKIFIGLFIVFSLNAFSHPVTAFSPSLHHLGQTDKLRDTSKKTNVLQYLSFKFKLFFRHLRQTWADGALELYLSGYAWHNRYTYSPLQLRNSKYNELAWGGGLGKGFFDEAGNWHGFYSIIFLDSHRNIEPVLGYAYLKIFHFTTHFKAGLGISVLLTARSDILHNTPFPGAVPWAGMFYKKVSIKAAYIPGSSTNGNVLYLVGTYTF